MKHDKSTLYTVGPLFQAHKESGFKVVFGGWDRYGLFDWSFILSFHFLWYSGLEVRNELPDQKAIPAR